MKAKEPQGDTDALVDGLSALSLTQKDNNDATETVKGLNVKQIKALVAQMAQLIPETQAKAEQLLEERDAALGHIGIQLGPDVPIRLNH